MVYSERKGFTLLELLIVIGILAILGTVTVLVLNPAELFKQARDSQRIENLGSLRSALSLYAATVATPDLDGATDSCTTLCYVNNDLGGANCGGRHTGKTTTANAVRTIDALGWIPVNFGSIPGGSPLSVLPVDPVNDATYFFSYACNNTTVTFELDANMESSRYVQGGADDVESKDGGNSATLYEVGNEPGLDI